MPILIQKLGKNGEGTYSSGFGGLARSAYVELVVWRWFSFMLPHDVGVSVSNNASFSLLECKESKNIYLGKQILLHCPKIESYGRLKGSGAA